VLTSVQIGMTAAKAERGGLDRYFFSLNRALPDQDVAVRGLVVGQRQDLEPGEHAVCFAPTDANLIKRWKALRHNVPGLLNGADLVVSHFAPYAFPVLDQIRSRPLVVHFHGPWASEGAAEGAGKASIFLKHAIERVVYARGSRLIVLSRAFASILEREYGVSQSRIEVVPGGVDVERFAVTGSRREARAILDWPNYRRIVFTLRRLVRAKGVENLIEAVDEVRRRVDDVLFIVAGTGPLATALRQRVAERKLDSFVRFVGYVADEDLPTLYRAADLFVVPTVALEGFGLVVLEALACGTPALVTPIAGLPEVVSELEKALIFEGTRPDQLASGIANALTGELRLPGEAQCIAYATRFSWPTIASRVAGIYREAVR
jgi:glycosyltransferase involved in cell wall biosynthesis